MRKVLIFGANSAIAQAVAEILAKEGAELFLVSRNSENLLGNAKRLEEISGRALGVFAADLRDLSLHGKIWEAGKSKLGDIDTVLIAHSELGSLDDAQLDPENVQNILQANLISQIAIASRAAEELKAKGKGTIAVITSVAGERGKKNNFVYASTKGAMSIFLSGLRQRLQTANVRVVDIRPGFINTPMTRQLKKGLLVAKPKDIAPKIARALSGGSEIIYVPGYWRWIMLLVRMIPEPIFKRMSL